MRLLLTTKDGASSSSLIKRIGMLEGVEDVEEDDSEPDVPEIFDADLGVWLEHDARRCDIEDLLHGTKGVKRVTILK